MMKDKILVEIDRQVLDQVQSQVINRVREHVWLQVTNRLRWKVGRQVQGLVWSQFYYKLGGRFKV
jgi:hypothetical protein